MTFLPIVERELRVAARRRLTHWARFGAALAALAVMFWVLALQSGTGGVSPKDTGKMLFVVLASMSFFFCLAFGGYTTADCLSAERRRGTLGLLFLTDLSGYDVVLGKLAATSVGAVYALLALVPVLALPLLMGGVAKELVWGVAASLLNTLFFALTAGMFVSAVSRDERHAITGTLALIAAIAGGLPVLAALLEWRHGAAQALFVCSPAYGFFLGLDALGTGRGAVPFWVSMAVTHGLAWLFLGLACVILPRTWREHGEDCARPGGWRERWRRWSPLRHWRKRPAGVLEDNPVTWLSCRRQSRLFGAWSALVLVGAGWLIGLWTVGEDWLSPPAPVVFMLLLHGALKYELAGEACRRFAEDRQSGALELLLATPLSVPEIIQGQQGALWRRFAGPTAAALVADILLTVGSMNRARSADDEVFVVMAAGMGMLVVDAAALAWLGMWNGLTARNFTLAWIKTMFWVLWLPWVVFLVLSITAAASGGPNLDFGGAVMVWLGIGVVADAVALTLAHARLSGRFRDYAAGRFGGRAVAIKDGG
jgi:hypothetical protein